MHLMCLFIFSFTEVTVIMSEGIEPNEITVHSQSQADVEALVQAAVSVLTNDIQVVKFRSTCNS